jgi:hypothetical protein
MNSLTQRERIVLAFIISLAFFVILFMTLQIAYYERYIPIEPFFKPEVAPIDDPLELKMENLEIQNSSGKIKNLTRNQEDQRERSETDYTENPTSGDPYQTAKDFEQQLFSEAGGNFEREKILKEQNQRKQNLLNEANKKNNNKGNNGNGNNKQYSGDVMVEWILSGRSAHENNNWWVRNPGYTCGYGASGKVVIRITVDQGGRVLQANYDANASHGANDCMVQQSVKYAKLSRFNYKEAAKSQQGTIIYKFISQ